MLFLTQVGTGIQFAIIVAAVIIVFFGYLILTQVINLKRDRYRAQVYKERRENKTLLEKEGDSVRDIVKELDKHIQQGDGNK